MRIWAMKKQTQTNPTCRGVAPSEAGSPTPKGVKQKSDAACQMN